MLRTILKFFPIVVFVVGIISTFSSNAQSLEQAAVAGTSREGYM